EVNERDSRGHTLLYQAVCDNDLPQVEFLLRHPCIEVDAVIKNALGYEISGTALLKATDKGYFEIIKALVRRDADVNICFHSSEHAIELTRHKIGDPNYGMKPKAYSYSTRYNWCPWNLTTSKEIKAYLKDHGARTRPLHEDYYDFEYERSGEWKKP
ncbi:MAG: ankyrin repeat domain-containing protein, partial [Bacteroidota bacterium]